MNESFKAELEQFLKNSELLRTVQRLKTNKGRSRLFGDNVRSLTDSEIRQLEAQGNRSDSWNQIWVTAGFKTDHIYDNYFIGKCVLGIFKGKATFPPPYANLDSGIYRSTIVNSEIGHHSLVFDVGILNNYIVHDRVLLFRIHSLTASSQCTFGNGIPIRVGMETGGREVLSFADLNIPLAEMVAKQQGNAELLETYQNFIHSFLEKATTPYGIIETGAQLCHSHTLSDVFVGDHCMVSGAQLLENSTILGNSDEKTEISHGALLKNACIQWGSEVTSMAVVENSVITEHAKIERHAKVIHCIVGPNCEIAEGEMTSCFVGPFVAFHHQALLIAAVWPEGRGNIGYGANVGSNHTSKAPDQEIWCGEGVFYGLGTNIKFPSDFTEAPYSIIATAVDTLPQKVEFPFSLINKPATYLSEISPAFNEIFPAWVLYDNIYMIKRNEGKYKKRNKARRIDIVFDILRPDIVDKMIRARNRLQHVQKILSVYTDRQIKGLGKNYLLEENRVRGVEGYNFYIEYYVLKGLMTHLSRLPKKDFKQKIHTIYQEKTADRVWEHQRNILRQEGWDQRSVADNLMRLKSMQRQIAETVQRSKEKDDIRGRKIIADYDDAYTPAEKDAFVQEVWQETEVLIREIDALLGQLSK